MLIYYLLIIKDIMESLITRSRDLAHGFLRFVNHAVSPYHAV